MQVLSSWSASPWGITTFTQCHCERITGWSVFALPRETCRYLPLFGEACGRGHRLRLARSAGRSVTPDHLEHGQHACIICAIAMNEHSLAEMATSSDQECGTKSSYRVLYDGQCEICQACVSWLKTLDHENKTICLPISADGLICGRFPSQDG